MFRLFLVVIAIATTAAVSPPLSDTKKNADGTYTFTMPANARPVKIQYMVDPENFQEDDAADDDEEKPITSPTLPSYADGHTVTGQGYMRAGQDRLPSVVMLTNKEADEKGERFTTDTSKELHLPKVVKMHRPTIISKDPSNTALWEHPGWWLAEDGHRYSNVGWGFGGAVHGVKIWPGVYRLEPAQGQKKEEEEDT